MGKNVGTNASQEAKAKGEGSYEFVPSKDFKGTLDGTTVINFKKGVALAVTQAQGKLLAERDKGQVRPSKGSPAAKGAKAVASAKKERIIELMKLKKEEIVALALELQLYADPADAKDLKKEEVAEAVADAEADDEELG